MAWWSIETAPACGSSEAEPSGARSRCARDACGPSLLLPRAETSECCQTIHITARGYSNRPGDLLRTVCGGSVQYIPTISRIPFCRRRTAALFSSGRPLAFEHAPAALPAGRSAATRGWPQLFQHCSSALPHHQSIGAVNAAPILETTPRWGMHLGAPPQSPGNMRFAHSRFPHECEVPATGVCHVHCHVCPLKLSARTFGRGLKRRCKPPTPKLPSGPGTPSSTPIPQGGQALFAERRWLLHGCWVVLWMLLLGPAHVVTGMLVLAC
jgi:hypothetical protein